MQAAYMDSLVLWEVSDWGGGDSSVDGVHLEDWSSDPQNPHKDQTGMAATCNPRTWRERHEFPRQATLARIKELWFQQRPCLNNVENHRGQAINKHT